MIDLIWSSNFEHEEVLLLSLEDENISLVLKFFIIIYFLIYQYIHGYDTDKFYSTNSLYLVLTWQCTLLLSFFCENACHISKHYICIGNIVIVSIWNFRRKIQLFKMSNLPNAFSWHRYRDISRYGAKRKRSNSGMMIESGFMQVVVAWRGDET